MAATSHAPPVKIGVLTYGDFPHLVRRTIESIQRQCERDSYRLVVGANAVSAATLAYLEALQASGAVDRLIVSPDNINKCPMMRRMLEEVSTEFFWWFDDDSYIVSPAALTDRVHIARSAPASHVMWGHVFNFGHENDFSYGTDVVGYVKRAPWFPGLEPPSWNPGGKGERDFEGKGTGDGRWFFITGGCWFIRTHVLRDLDGHVDAPRLDAARAAPVSRHRRPSVVRELSRALPPYHRPRQESRAPEAVPGHDLGPYP